MTYYFGYGSNLELEDFYSWCLAKNFENVSLKPVTPAFLVDSALQFHYYSKSRQGGAADVVQFADWGTDGVVKGFACPGVLFLANDNAMEALDKKEGHPNAYKRAAVKVATCDLGIVDAITYFCVPERITGKFEKPTKEYVGLIKTGLEAFQLPTDMLLSASKGHIIAFSQPNILYCFVYGTLRKGQSRSKTMNDLENKVGNAIPAAVKGKIVVCGDGDYPGLLPVPEDSDELVYGELYEFRGSMHGTLGILDAIEGFYGRDNEICLYYRVVAKVFKNVTRSTVKQKQDVEALRDPNNQEWVWAWTYVYTRSKGKEKQILSGDWTDRT